MAHTIVGVILLILGILGIVCWWADFGLVLRGAIPLFLAIGGLVAIGSGLSRKAEGEPGSETH